MSFQTESMLFFDSLYDLEVFYQKFPIYQKWKITDQDINIRGNSVRNADYINYFKDKFNEKGLFRRSVSIAELVSFVDGYYIMKKIIEKLKNEITLSQFINVSLVSEYRIKMSKNRRIDFIFIYKSKILLVEFRITNKFPNQGSIWQRKETELLIYKELLTNYIKDKEIYIYAFLGMPEHKNNQLIEKNIKYNENNIGHFVEYIKTFILTENH